MTDDFGLRLVQKGWGRWPYAEDIRWLGDCLPEGYAGQTCMVKITLPYLNGAVIADPALVAGRPILFDYYWDMPLFLRVYAADFYPYEMGVFER